MNKLLLEPQIFIEQDGTYQVLDASSLSIITVLPNVECDIVIEGVNVSQTLQLHVQKNAKVRVQSFLQNVHSTIDIFLEEQGASVQFIYSMIATNASGMRVRVEHLAPYTDSIFYNSIVQKGDELASIQVDAVVNKGNVGCHLHQDNKIILMGNGKGKILPNLFIDEFDCFAEHSAYVSKFSKEALFYLEMRGIPRKEATFLLTKSLLLGKFVVDDEYLSKFTEILKNGR